MSSRPLDPFLRSNVGGLLIYDVTHPAHPEYVGCNGQDGYTHDAQCVVYHGPDANYTGREVCATSYWSLHQK